MMVEYWRKNGAFTVISELLKFEGTVIDYGNRKTKKWNANLYRQMLSYLTLHQELIEKILEQGVENLEFSLDDSCRKITGHKFREY